MSLYIRYQSSLSGGGGGVGTVTSVAMTVPSFLSVSGSPITTAGTLAVSLNTESANTVFAGPASGSAATPTFRNLVINDIPSLSGLYVTQAEVGAPSGVAPLDASGKIATMYLPSTVLQYQGTWNPSTNTPTLADSSGTSGDVYWASAAAAGPISGLNNASMYNFQIGDLIIYNGTQWELTTPAAGVQSVNGAQGAVTVNAINQLSGDVTTSAASGSQSEVATLATVNSNVGSFTNASITVNAKGLVTAASSGSAPVGSVSVATANGFAGTSSGGTSPTLTLSTTITGILQGNGTAISAASTTGSGAVVLATSPTLVTPALGTPSALVGTNITGTASSLTAGNINATSNSTLTTLSALSLPGSQVTGNISGNAANITATSNSTLTTLSALSLPTSQLSGSISLTTQVSGVLPIANGGTDNGSLAVTAGGVLYTDGTKFQNVGAGTSGQYLKSNGSSAPTWAAAPTPTYTAPTQTRLTSNGGTGTYTAPTGALYLRVRMVGGGGGGGSSGTGGGTAPSGGGNSYFYVTGQSSTSLLVCNGGSGGALNGNPTGGAGGSTTVNSPAYGTALTGGAGGGGSTTGQGGGMGAASPFGGGGAGGYAGNGGAAPNNTGSGGGGAGTSSGMGNGGSGGGAGGFIDAIIPSPTTTSGYYSYQVGGDGGAGSAGTSGNAGGNGGSGYIEITEYYQ